MELNFNLVTTRTNVTMTAGSVVKIGLETAEIVLILNFNDGWWVDWFKRSFVKKNLSTKIKAPQKLGPNSKVNIRLVTAEILLTYKVWSKSG